MQTGLIVVALGLLIVFALDGSSSGTSTVVWWPEKV